MAQMLVWESGFNHFRDSLINMRESRIRFGTTYQASLTTACHMSLFLRLFLYVHGKLLEEENQVSLSSFTTLTHKMSIAAPKRKEFFMTESV